MPEKFDLEEMEKRILRKLHPPTPITSLNQRFRGLASRFRIPKRIK